MRWTIITAVIITWIREVMKMKEELVTLDCVSDIWLLQQLFYRSWHYWDDFTCLCLSSALMMMMRMKMMVSLSRSHSLMNGHVKRFPPDSQSFDQPLISGVYRVNRRWMWLSWPLITAALADSGILGHPRYVTLRHRRTSWVVTRACVRQRPLPEEKRSNESDENVLQNGAGLHVSLRPQPVSVGKWWRQRLEWIVLF